MKSPERRILVIDNYDSFTYNLVHLLRQITDDLVVRRNDQFSLEEVLDFSHILISPGPGLPQDAGLVPELISRYHTKKSFLGICLGMQALLSHAGIPLLQLPRVAHGAMDTVRCQEPGVLFQGLPDTFQVGRYHSWAFLPQDLDGDYKTTAVSSDGYLMAVEHRILPIYGVQFHPESIMTEYGLEIIQNWLDALPSMHPEGRAVAVEKDGLRHKSPSP